MPAKGPVRTKIGYLIEELERRWPEFGEMDRIKQAELMGAGVHSNSSVSDEEAADIRKYLSGDRDAPWWVGAWVVEEYKIRFNEDVVIPGNEIRLHTGSRHGWEGGAIVNRGAAERAERERREKLYRSQNLRGLGESATIPVPKAQLHILRRALGGLLATIDDILDES